MESKKAYITFLSRPLGQATDSDPYVLYTIALWHSWKLTNSKYDFYVIMTDTLTPKSVEMMHNLGIKTITITTNEFDDLVKGSKDKKNWIEALKKLAISGFLGYGE